MAEEIRNNKLFKELTSIIEMGKKNVVAQVNSTLTLVYWKVGHKINEYVLEGERAEYAKNIVVTVSRDLETLYGRGFAEKNIRRMIQFSKVFKDFEIVATLSTKLSWSHFVTVIPIEEEAKRLFYLKKAIEEQWSVRMLRKQIERKAYERKEIAQIQIKDSLA